MAHSRRAITTAVLALGFALGTPALAAADTYFHSQDAWAGPGGASITVTRSVANDDGSVRFETVTYTAGPGGASVSHVGSGAG